MLDGRVGGLRDLLVTIENRPIEAEGGEETLPEETENGEAPAADAEEPAEGIDPAEAGAVVVD